MNQPTREEIDQALFQQDLRIEVLLRAVVDVLVQKKVLTAEEVNDVAARIKNELIAQAQKAMGATNGTGAGS